MGWVGEVERQHKVLGSRDGGGRNDSTDSLVEVGGVFSGGRLVGLLLKTGDWVVGWWLWWW